jgi:hypothetical protein
VANYFAYDEVSALLPFPNTGSRNAESCGLDEAEKSRRAIRKKSGVRLLGF